MRAAAQHLFSMQSSRARPDRFSSIIRNEAIPPGIWRFSSISNDAQCNLSGLGQTGSTSSLHRELYLEELGPIERISCPVSGGYSSYPAPRSSSMGEPLAVPLQRVATAGPLAICGYVALANHFSGNKERANQLDVTRHGVFQPPSDAQHGSLSLAAPKTAMGKSVSCYAPVG